jgi:DNA-binding transcriptional LysR family regulator
MELRHLTYFVTVAETENFTKAAARCFVAQSALSQQVARLETEVGASLFLRNSRSVRLTEAGEVLLPLARRILADVDNAQAELDALRGLRRGRLRLGLLQSVANPVDQIAAISAFHERYPGIDIRVTDETSSAMVEAVGAGTLDVAIVGLGPDTLPPALSQRTLATDPLVAVVSQRHPLAGRATVGVAALVGTRPFIHFVAGSGVRHHVNAAFGRAGVTVNHSFEMGQLSDMVRLAALDIGVTIVPSASVGGAGSDLEIHQDYRVIRLADEAAVHPVSVVYDAAHRSPATSAFLEVLEHQSMATPHELSDGSSPLS